MPNIIADAYSQILTTTNASSQETPSKWGMLAGYYGGDYPAWASNQRESIMRIMNDGASDIRGLEYWTKFDRFYTIPLNHEMPSGRHYIFICRPDLNLLEPYNQSDSGAVKLSSDSGVDKDPKFMYWASMYPQIIASLTGDFAGFGSLALSSTSQAAVSGSGYGNSSKTDGTTVTMDNGQTVNLTMHTFIPYLTSRVESLQLPDYTIKQSSLVQPYTKFTIPYTTSAIESTTGGTFDITFRDDKDYSITKLFFAWTYYQDGVMRNIFKPKDKYLKYNALDYATSIYDFLVDATGENIVYWAKYTGAIPTSVPLSNLSFNRNSGGENKVSIPFAYFVCEHMDFNVLMDFQYNSLGYIAMKNHFAGRPFQPFSLDQTIPIYDNREGGFLGSNFAKRPVIIFATGSGGQKAIKLRWI